MLTLELKISLDLSFIKFRRGYFGSCTKLREGKMGSAKAKLLRSYRKKEDHGMTDFLNEASRRGD